MAFGKKKSKDEEEAVEAMAEGALAADAGEAIDGGLFASDAGAADADAPAVDGAQAEDAPATEAAPAEAPAAGGGADPLGGADLLSMFQTTQIEVDDKAALLELAGEVEMDDLLEELQTVAVAMGVKRG